MNIRVLSTVSALLILPILKSPCESGKAPEAVITEYLDNAVTSAENDRWQEMKEWFYRIELKNNIKTSSVIPYLSRGNEHFKVTLIETLGELGDRKSVKPLVQMLSSGEPVEVKLTIIETLGKLKDKRAVKTLETYLNHELWSVRAMAAWALENITGRQYDYDTTPNPR